MNRWCTHELRKANMRTVLSRYSKCSTSHGEQSDLYRGLLLACPEDELHTESRPSSPVDPRHEKRGVALQAFPSQLSSTPAMGQGKVTRLVDT